MAEQEQDKCHKCGTHYPSGSEHGECDWCPGVAIRRKRRRDVAPEEIEQMRELEESGAARKAIALRFQISQSAVTRHLGAVRCYREKRRAVCTKK